MRCAIGVWVGLVLAVAPARAADLRVLLSGRVVEAETKRPIAGCEVRFERDLISPDEGPAPGWIGTDRVRTDACGRFSCLLPPADPMDPRLRVTLAFRHPGRVAQAAVATLNGLVGDREWGPRPWCEVALEEGVEYAATAVRPDGSPAADVRFLIMVDPDPSVPSGALPDIEGRTDAQGRLRARLPACRRLWLWLYPEDLARLSHRIESAEGRVPSDLGRYILDAGGEIAGRVLDREGRPVSGLVVRAVGDGQKVCRRSMTDADGRYRLRALRSADYYQIEAESGDQAPTHRPRSASHPVTPLLAPRLVALGPHEQAEGIDLLAAEGVTITARVVDGRGRPACGPISVCLTAHVESLPAPVSRFPIFWPREQPGGVEVGGVRDGRWATLWVVRQEQLTPDASGRVMFRAPKRLLNTSISATAGPGAVLSYREAPGGPLIHVDRMSLPDPDGDPPCAEFVVQRSPTIRVRVVGDGGLPLPQEIQVVAVSPENPGMPFETDSFLRERDGRFRILGLYPDQPYEIRASAEGYVTASSEKVQLPEGGSADLTLVLARAPRPARVGDLAPPVLVRTLDGRARSLADDRGKYLLVHAWSAEDSTEDIALLKDLRERFARDPRLALLGLSFDPNPRVLATFLRDEKIPWPQARLGSQADAVMAAYGWEEIPTAVLIGPDGTIVEAGLRGEEIEAALEKHLKAPSRR